MALKSFIKESQLTQLSRFRSFHISLREKEILSSFIITETMYILSLLQLLFELLLKQCV